MFRARTSVLFVGRKPKSDDYGTIKEVRCTISGKYDVQSAEQVRNEMVWGIGLLRYRSAGTPAGGLSGFAPGALAQDTTNGLMYYNSGNKTSATWTVIGSGALASNNTWTGTNTFSGAVTLASAPIIGSTQSLLVPGQMGVISATSSTLSVTAAAHAGFVISLSRLAGVAVTLPAPTGTGQRYIFVIGLTLTSASYTIDAKGGDGSAVISGNFITTGPTFYSSASNTNLITLPYTTVTAGILGDWIEIVDVATHQWIVRGNVTMSGTPASPFSNH